MSAHAIALLLGILGSLGLAGTVALAVFAPALAAALFREAVALERAVLATRIGVAVTAALLCGGLGYLYAGMEAEDACTAKITTMQANAEDAGHARDDALGKSLERQFGPAIKTLGDEAASRKQQAQQHADRLAHAPDRHPVRPDTLRLLNRPE